MCVYVCMRVYIYICLCIYVDVYVYIYIGRAKLSREAWPKIVGPDKNCSSLALAIFKKGQGPPVSRFFRAGLPFGQLTVTLRPIDSLPWSTRGSTLNFRVDRTATIASGSAGQEMNRIPNLFSPLF